MDIANFIFCSGINVRNMTKPTQTKTSPAVKWLLFTEGAQAYVRVLGSLNSSYAIICNTDRKNSVCRWFKIHSNLYLFFFFSSV